MHWPWQRGERTLITAVGESPLENYERRKRSYEWLQGVRIPFLLLAALFFLVWHNLWLAGLFTVISVPLPWIAVVIANGVGERPDRRRPRVYKPGAVRQARRDASPDGTSATVEPPTMLALPPGHSATVKATVKHSATIEATIEHSATTPEPTSNRQEPAP